jgi:uncharacterized paraquat-inducible protein A
MRIKITTMKTAAVFTASVAAAAWLLDFPRVFVGAVFITAAVAFMPVLARWIAEFEQEPIPDERRKILRVPYGPTELRQCAQCQTAYFPDPVTPDDPVCPRCLEELIFQRIKDAK